MRNIKEDRENLPFFLRFFFLNLIFLLLDSNMIDSRISNREYNQGVCVICSVRYLIKVCQFGILLLCSNTLIEVIPCQFAAG